MTIRFAKTRDIPRLLALLKQVNNVHHEIRPDLFVAEQTKYDAAALETMLADPAVKIFVAADAQGLVQGYLLAYLRPRRGVNLTGGVSFYIDDLCVDEACRGQGVGRALFDRAKTYAAEAGCREVLLNVWEGNDAALRFYSHCGLRPRSRLLELETGI